MERRATPTLVAQVAERQRKIKEIDEVREQTQELAEHITDIIHDTVSDPALDTEGFYLNKGVEVVFPFMDGEEVVNVFIKAPRYPDERKPFPTYQVHTGAKLILVSSEQNIISSSGNQNGTISVGFDQKDFNELHELLDGIEQGVKDGSIEPRVIRPTPERRNIIDILIEDQYVAPLG